MTKELDGPFLGEFTKGQAESTASKAAEEGAHDHAFWAQHAAEAAERARATAAQGKRALKGGGA